MPPPTADPKSPPARVATVAYLAAVLATAAPPYFTACCKTLLVAPAAPTPGASVKASDGASSKMVSATGVRYGIFPPIALARMLLFAS